jgi:hypothetical protein
VPQVQIGQSDPNLTVYAVQCTYAYSGQTFMGTAYVEWAPQFPDFPTPLPPLQQQALFDPSKYYWCTSWTHALGLFNTAFATARANAITAFNTWNAAHGGGATAPTSAAPTLIFSGGSFQAI